MNTQDPTVQLREAVEAVKKATPGAWFPDAYGDIYGGENGETPVCNDLYERDKLAILYAVNWVRDHAEDTIALLSRLTGEGWQPIETAPKDGEVHLRGLWVTIWRDGKPAEREWRIYAGFCHADGPFVDVDYCQDFGWEPEDFEAWMPQPTPPALAPATKEAQP